MARGPRKSPDRSLDLSRHLLPIDSLPSPLLASALFASGPSSDLGSQSPVEVEVGSGKGLFLTTAAKTFPNRKFVGVEIAKPYASLCASRLVQQGLTNAVMVMGDAGVLFRHLLADACLAAVHVYFPDPWWKARHRKRRVLSTEFLTHAARTIKPGGSLHIWSDVEDYFIESLELAAATVSYETPRDVPEQSAVHDLDYRTHFERRTRLTGGRVWRTVLIRNESPPKCDRLPLPDEQDAVDRHPPHD
ncbi:MAG: tRNA (guanosine(46)-N7)-methyltransferase TrmB [Planctomycetaceae bacterium]